MINQQNLKFFTLFILSLLLTTTAILSWYLLDLLSGAGLSRADEIISSSTVLLIKATLILALIIAVVMIVKELKTPFTNRNNSKKMEKIIENATTDNQQIRSAIIRLRQIVDPEQMKLAVSIATLLNQLLSTIEKISGDHEQQHQENLSLSKTASELKVKHDRLIQAPHLRSEFLSRMGDEITLPMENLGTMLNLLKTMELDPEAKNILVIANHSAHSLIENISNILEFSKLNANLKQLNKDYFNLAETIRSVLETQESIALSKGLFIETHIKPNVPEMIKADQKSMVKVLDNLISNAIRFTDRGDIQLEVDHQTEGSKTLLRFTVIDTGIGIPESALPRLFDSLDKNTPLVNSSFTGRLRLIVSQQLCELMGGDIGVESKQGTGSRFWFTIDISN